MLTPSPTAYGGPPFEDDLMRIRREIATSVLNAMLSRRYAQPVDEAVPQAVRAANALMRELGYIS